LLAGLAKKPYIFFKMHWAWIGASRRDDHPESRTDAAEHVVGRFFEQIRSGSEITPPTSFYEQVRGRIEQIERQSVWVPFIYSGVPLRLAMSFLALSLIALGYVFIAESNIKEPRPALDGEAAGAIFHPGDEQQQRDAVLLQIIAYQRRN
jgi:hypothetical protein